MKKHPPSLKLLRASKIQMARLKTKKRLYKIEGMDCASCASLLELELEEVGIKSSCSYPTETLTIEQSSLEIDEKKIEEVVEKMGYKLLA